MFSGPMALPRTVSILLLILLSGLLSFWTLQLVAPRPAIAPPPVASDANENLNLAPAATLFGIVPASDDRGEPVPEEVSDIKVTGIMSGPRGVALLALDDKPARPYAVGAMIDNSTRLRSVSVGEVLIERSGRTLRLSPPKVAGIEVLTGDPKDHARTGLPGITVVGGKGGTPSYAIPSPAAPNGFAPPAGAVIQQPAAVPAPRTHTGAQTGQPGAAQPAVQSMAPPAMQPPAVQSAPQPIQQPAQPSPYPAQQYQAPNTPGAVPDLSGGAVQGQGWEATPSHMSGGYNPTGPAQGGFQADPNAPQGFGPPPAGN